MPLEWFLAIRFLREGRAQTWLMIAGVAVGVGVAVFVSALIDGLQQDLLARVLSSQAHVTLEPAEERARPLRAAAPGEVLVRRVERPAQRARSIAEWQRVLRELEATPGVTAVSPKVSGPAFAVRGDASRAVALLGVDPARFDRVVPMSERMSEGGFDVDGSAVVLGVVLARELGVGLGDVVRLQAASGRTATFTVRGLFSVGTREIDERWVFVALRDAQTLLSLPGGVTHLDARVAEPFEAEALATRLEARTGLVVESWMGRNAQLLTALRSQSGSTALIQLFVLVSVAMGIASVLAVSVVQKGREIGILRAVGTRRGVVLRLFLMQGGLVGLGGSSVGAGLGVGLALLFQHAMANPDGTPFFPVLVTPGLFLEAGLVATAAGLLAAVVPARRAACLDPAVAIRA